MWMIFLSICVCVPLVMLSLLCICWKKKPSKDEWQGLDGMVTQKNPDENVNHLPSAAPFVADVLNTSGDSLDSNTRSTLPSNTRRSLPDIPSEQGTAIIWEPAGDNSSEHYATVGQYRHSAKRHTIPNGVDPRPSISQHSSISQADDALSPYARVQYGKINSKENPYAQLQPTTSRPVVYEESSSSSEERTNLLRIDGPSSLNEPTAPPRSRRSSAHSSLGVEIPAASAVAGGISASPDLPYMTPPVTQANFSGDSQDSSKGYTSISVREPLANIIAQTKEMNKKHELDSHYATVSDDSDDVYTTIPDANNQIYTSESETYARIGALPITVEVEVNAPPSRPQANEETSDQLYEPAPQQPPPPSVDSLKQVTAHSHSHSRQASSSSSVANIGSPKPEKRQANSPLPPPPTATSFDFHTDKPQVRNLDDLYAKVHKNKTNDTVTVENTPEKVIVNESNRKSTSTIGSHEEKPEKKHREHNYETLRKSPRKVSDPGYEKIKHEEPGYASINGPESITSSDPGYEVLKHRTPSEVDPNYEELKHRTSNASDCAGYSRIKEKPTADMYSVVNKPNKTDKSNSSSNTCQDLSLSDDHNYESMPNESLEHYAAIKSNGSESDPNYESVSQNDPNYESVKDLEDPPYERLDDDSSSRTDSDLPGYEKVRKKGYENADTSESSISVGKSTSEKSEPPYEQLNTDTDSEIPGYEQIKGSNVKSLSTDSGSSSGGNSEEPNYASVKGDIKKSGPSNSIHDEDAIFQV